MVRYLLNQPLEVSHLAHAHTHTPTHTHTLSWFPHITELRSFGTQLERAVLEESQPAPSPTLPAKPKLPPLTTTMQPRPPATVNCSSQLQSFSRASQVRRRDSRKKSSTDSFRESNKQTCPNDNTSKRHLFHTTSDCSTCIKDTVKDDPSSGIQPQFHDDDKIRNSLSSLHRPNQSSVQVLSSDHTTLQLLHSTCTDTSA